MANWHYYNEDGDKVGPVTDRQLKQLAKNGIVVPGMVVETEDGKTGLAKDVEGLTFTESALKLATLLRPYNEVGVVPPDTGEVYGLTTPLSLPQKPLDTPNLLLDSETVVKKKPAPGSESAVEKKPTSEKKHTSPPSAPPSTPRTKSHWNWADLLTRSILTVFVLICLIGAVVFAGLQWYRTSLPTEQAAHAGVQLQLHPQPPPQPQQPQPQQQEVIARDNQRNQQPPFENIFEAAARGTVNDIRFFLDRRNAEINQTDARGWTPLHYAAERNSNPAVVQYLVERGANVNAVNHENRTPLDIAGTGAKWVIVRDAGGTTSPPYQSSCKDIWEAAEKGTVQDVDFFVKNGFDVNARDGDNDTLLHCAARHNPSFEVLHYLVSLGADVKARGRYNATPLHRAAGGNSNVEILKYLVSQGADINARANGARTPLDWACQDNPNIEILKYLVSQGADVNALNFQNETLLHRALLRATFGGHDIERDIEKVEYLVSQRVNINAQNTHGDTSLHFAARIHRGSGEILRHLVSVRGVDVNAKNNDGKTPLDVANTEEQKAILRAAGGKNGADVNARKKDEAIPSPMAARAVPYQSSFKDVWEAAQKGTVGDVDFFVRNGGNLNGRDGKKNTPLHYAATLNSDVEVLRYLVAARGIYVNARNGTGKTPLDLARTEEKRAILRAAGGKIAQSLIEGEFAKKFSGWSIKNCATDQDYFGLQKNYRNRENVFRTHPPSRDVPCVLGYRTDIPANKTTFLRVVVSNYPNRDWVLVCRVNGSVQRTVTVDEKLTKGGWASVSFDLTPFAGRKDVQIELENKANDWAWEDGFWASLTIDSKLGKPE